MEICGPSRNLHAGNDDQRESISIYAEASSYFMLDCILISSVDIPPCCWRRPRNSGGQAAMANIRVLPILSTHPGFEPRLGFKLAVDRAVFSYYSVDSRIYSGARNSSY